MQGDGSRRLIGALAGAVAIAALAGCSDDPAPDGTVSSSGAATTSSAPATPRPQPPLQEPTPRSAEEFTRYFWDLYNYSYATNDTQLLNDISDPACAFCGSALDDIERIVQTGAKATGSRVAVVDTTSPEGDISKGTLVIATVSQEPGEIVQTSGRSEKDPGYKSLRTDFALRWNGQSWSVLGVDAHTESGTPWVP